MIYKDAIWINIVPTDPEERERRCAPVRGKWLCFGPTAELHLFPPLLEKLVQRGILRSVKIARKDPATDPFPYKECVMCVYTSDDKDEVARVKKELRQIGLQPSVWKSELETIKDWGLDGVLLLEKEIADRRREVSGAVSPFPGSGAAKPRNKHPQSSVSSGHAEVGARSATRRAVRESGGASSTGQYDVFISYRREDGASTARLIQSELRQRNIRAFLDIDDLRPGHFDDALLGQIDNASGFLLVLSPGCLERCSDPGDWLKREISHAIRRDKKIIPIMMPGFVFPEARQLPAEIRAIRIHQAVSYSHEFFNAMIEKIIRYLAFDSA